MDDLSSYARAISIPQSILADLPTDPTYLLSHQSPIMPGPHASHPNFGHLTMLVFEAVMEVVCVSLPGYIVARLGMFDSKNQKFVANLNIMLFTPCLIFSKLARQLDGDRLGELAVIPVILLVQTLVSFAAAKVLIFCFRIKKKPQQNFVKAMAVFGNSNSLPLSLVISLSHTISGLHWDKIPGDNDAEVAARGILYLLIFSQIGQAARWSWGMNSLMKPLDQYTPIERGEIFEDEESTPYKDISPSASSSSIQSKDGASSSETATDPQRNEEEILDTAAANVATSSAARQQTNHRQRALIKSVDGNVALDGAEDEHDSDQLERPALRRATTSTTGVTGFFNRMDTAISDKRKQATAKIALKSRQAFKSLPLSTQTVLSKIGSRIARVAKVIWGFINVPLVAIFVSLFVALIPSFKRFFFTEKTFVNNSVTRAIEQMGGVAIPLILVVLGGNLARNTLPDEGLNTREMKRDERKVVSAALLSRMLIPTIVMAPILALAAKYIPVSILDDPIFVIVCFLLTGAPSALQLAQICQVNGLYVGWISRILLHSYVTFILPSTIILVMLALEVVEWAAKP